MVKITEIMDNTDSSESENERDSDDGKLPMCRYGLSCYRKNPVHFMQFRHPPKVPSRISGLSQENVSVKIEIGHKGILKSEKNPQDSATHDWTIFVQGAEQNRIEHFVERVVFNLPQHYPDPKRVVSEPPFSIESSGYGSFVMLIDILFRNSVEPKKIRFTYDLYLKDNASFTNVRLEKLTFQNPNAEFKQLLLRAGGDILENPDSSTTSGNKEEPSTSANNKKRKVSSENLVSTYKNDEYDIFGQHCAQKLKKLEESCPLQKVIAEKLISDVFYHAQLKSLSAESSIFTLKTTHEEPNTTHEEPNTTHEGQIPIHEEPKTPHEEPPHIKQEPLHIKQEPL